ncbi:MAG: C40 family peptidase [Clostridiales bacterium]|nr:C40 family peptidase [Clostridiales bacterium]
MKISRKTISAAVFLLVCIAALILIIRYENNSRPRLLNGEQTASLLEAAEYPSEAAKTAVQSAASLIGRVHYFWGGKSFMTGEDPEWGVEKTVTSPGHSTSGTVRPFGLDCSGLVTWAYIQAGVSLDEIGNGTWNQWFNSEPIEKSELRPGDLGFSREYPGSSGNHVGIFIGFYKGRPVFIHCSPTYDNVAATTGDGVFNYYRRPLTGGASD